MTPQERIWLGQLRREMDRIKAEVANLHRESQTGVLDEPMILPPHYTGSMIAAMEGHLWLPPDEEIIANQSYLFPITISGEGPYIAESIHIMVYTDDEYNPQGPY